jgi:multisubunit Na+/H+ antiporter MnhE subunit
MLQAAAMLVGLWAAWLLLTQARFTPEQIGVAVAIACLCVAVGVRFGGLRGLGFPPGVALQRLRRAPETFRAALGAARAAIAADISLRPALIRIKPRQLSASAKAAFADAISANPGWIAVESDAEGLLAHVLDEEAVEPHQISALEDGVRAAYGLRGQV